LCASNLAACADARGRFEDFQNRLAEDAGVATDDGGVCTPPEPNSVAGPALLAIDTSLTAGHPILFLGRIDTPPLEGTTAVHFAYRALDSLDRRTRVGDGLEVGPFALHEGVLNAPVPESTLDGDANPLLHGAPITSEMTLNGHICGISRFYCGTLTGSTSGLLSGPFTGTFGITLLDGPDAVPGQPRFGCAADDVAPPL
ncbi:MAG: hypothetical protein ABW061_15870, partial [Polyangiaceae bacterium]